MTGNQIASLFCCHAPRSTVLRSRQAAAHNTTADRVANRAAGQACSSQAAAEQAADTADRRLARQQLQSPMAWRGLIRNPILHMASSVGRAMLAIKLFGFTPGNQPAFVSRFSQAVQEDSL